MCLHLLPGIEFEVTRHSSIPRKNDEEFQNLPLHDSLFQDEEDVREKEIHLGRVNHELGELV
jgi:hypothetical protein